MESLAGLREVDDGSPDFLFRNSFLRLAFLLLVDGLFLFSTFGTGTGTASHLYILNDHQETKNNFSLKSK